VLRKRRANIAKRGEKERQTMPSVERKKGKHCQVLRERRANIARC
jgi:hypothetical protein